MSEAVERMTYVEYSVCERDASLDHPYLQSVNGQPRDRDDRHRKITGHHHHGFRSWNARGAQMSIDAGIHIQIEAENTDWPLSVLDSLSHAGWNMDDHGKLVYLPLGDDDDFEWTEHPPGAGDIKAIFKAKLSAGEPLSVVLTWGDTQIGGTVIIRPTGILTFSASINRQCLGNSSTTDVSWYLPKLLFAIGDTGVRISSWEWTESA